MNDTYELLIDIGDADIWSVGKLGDDNSHYYFQDSHGRYWWFPKSFVENQPSMFRKIEPEKEFVWDDAKVKEILALYWDKPVADVSKVLDIQIERFKASKTNQSNADQFITDSLRKDAEKQLLSEKPKEDKPKERIVVMGLFCFAGEGCRHLQITVGTNEISAATLESIKQAIEKIVNNED